MDVGHDWSNYDRRTPPTSGTFVCRRCGCTLTINPDGSRTYVYPKDATPES